MGNVTNRVNELLMREKTKGNITPLFNGAAQVDIVVAEIMDPAQARLPINSANVSYCRLLCGDAFAPIDELTFLARNINNLSLVAGDKVFVLINNRQAPLILSGIAGAGGGVGDLVPHSHQGFYDGGWAGFLSGSL